MSPAVRGPDGRLRCPWATGAEEYVAYHDMEWGVPVRDDAGLYERLSLEAFQSGLSWLTILRKRPDFRRAFRGFDPAIVATFTAEDVDRLLVDATIVRNRRKIDAAVTNARATLELGPGGLTRLVWEHAPVPGNGAGGPQQVPASTPESVALAAALRRAGFVFVGPTTIYALMQACGVVDDHLLECFRRGHAAAGEAGVPRVGPDLG
jgi:DNA-3-methyladenine glycosylase I